jgi:hypothetical protein
MTLFELIEAGEYCNSSSAVARSVLGGVCQIGPESPALFSRLPRFPGDFQIRFRCKSSGCLRILSKGEDGFVKITT